MRIFALDGHDAAGKTTLAAALADATGARYGRPLSGAAGRRIIGAYEAGRHQDVLSIGHHAILSQLEDAEAGESLVFDRGWVTVATLMPRETFAASWKLWIPSALLWCDEATTRTRLQARKVAEEEPDDWHAHFLASYIDRFNLRPGEVVRTDLLTESACLAVLVRLFEEAPMLELREFAV